LDSDGDVCVVLDVYEAGIIGTLEVSKDSLHRLEMRIRGVRTGLGELLNCVGQFGASTKHGIHERADHRLMSTLSSCLALAGTRRDPDAMGVETGF
jgi:hypothetical protein